MSKSNRSGRARRSGRSAALHIVLIVVFLTTAAVSAAMLLANIRENRESGKVYASLEEFLTVPTAAPSHTAAPQPSIEPSSAVTSGTDAEPAAPSDVPVSSEPAEPTPVPLPEADFEALEAMNPDIVAWIRIEGTGLSYPVVQAADNEYYLDHIFDGTRNRAGCPYLDCKNSPDFTDRCSIIYGHNRRNGAMFAPLLNYTKQSYLDAHPSVTLLLPEGGYTVDIFAVLYADPGEAGSDTSPWRRSFTDREALDEWAAALAARSIVDCGDAPSTGRVLTLSTCDNGSNGRFVVLGWIPVPEDGEEPDVPADVPVEPGSVPADTSAEPAEVSAEPVGTSTEPMEVSAEPADISAEPSVEPTEEPSDVSAEPADLSTEPSDVPAEPSVGPAETSADTSPEPSDTPADTPAASAEPNAAPGGEPVA